MDEYNTGIWFDMATFSQQGDAGKPWDNEWDHTDPSSHLKVDGTLQIATKIDWYFRGSDNPSNTYSPNPYDPLIVFANSNQTGSSINCETALLANDDFSRDLVFGPVVGDSAEYADHQDEAEYLANSALFQRLSEDTSLLIIDSPADSAFNAFYQNQQSGNIGKFDSVRIALGNDDLETAEAINESIEAAENTDIEYNVKAINGLLIDVVVPGDTLSSSDTVALAAIFDQHWIEGGLGVYSAAALLFREYYPPAIEYRMTAPPSPKELDFTEDESSSIQIFPVPAGERVFFTGLPENASRIEIRDVYGNVVCIHQVSGAQYELNISGFSSGIYLVVIKAAGNILMKSKIAVLR